MGAPKKARRVTGRKRPAWDYRAPKKDHYFLAGLRRIRMDRWITQDELAERSGVSRPMISMLETGSQRGSPRTIPKLADALGVEPKELLMSQTVAEMELARMEEEQAGRELSDTA